MPEYVVDVRVTVNATYIVDAESPEEAARLAEYNGREDAEAGVGNYGWADAYATADDVREATEEDDY